VGKITQVKANHRFSINRNDKSRRSSRTSLALQSTKRCGKGNKNSNLKKGYRNNAETV
jgi:hypothetical protein